MKSRRSLRPKTVSQSNVKVMFSFITRELFLTNSFHKIKQPIAYIILKFKDDCVKEFEGRDLNFSAVMNMCCTMTIFLLIRRFFHKQLYNTSFATPVLA